MVIFEIFFEWVETAVFKSGVDQVHWGRGGHIILEILKPYFKKEVSFFHSLIA